MDNNNDNEGGETTPESNNSRLSSDDEDMNSDSDSSLTDFVFLSPSSDEIESTVIDTPTPKVLLKSQPKHKWSIVKEIIKRENGAVKMPELFPQSFYSSLHAVQRLELMYKLEAHSGCVNAINFNSSGTRLVSGSDDTTVVLWDWRIGKRLETFQTGHTRNVFQCKFLPFSDDKYLVTCARDGQVRLALQTTNGGYDNFSCLACHSKACHKLATLPDTPHVFLSAGEDAWVFSLDVRLKRSVDKILEVKDKGKKVGLYSIHANPMTGNEICVAGDDFKIRMYDRRCIRQSGSNVIKFYPAACMRQLTNEDDPDGPDLGKNPFVMKFFNKNISFVTCAVFNYNGTEIIGSYNDDDIYLFDTKCSDGKKYVHKYEGHSNGKTVKGVNFFGPKSEYIVSGSDCGNIYFWDKNTESIVQWMRGDQVGVINCLEPHPSIPVLATSGLDADVKIWVPSCENEPKMTGLKRTLASNQRKKNSSWSHKVSFSNDLVRWWKEFKSSNGDSLSSLSEDSSDSDSSSSSSHNLDPMGSDSDTL